MSIASEILEPFCEFDNKAILNQITQRLEQGYCMGLLSAEHTDVTDAEKNVDIAELINAAKIVGRNLRAEFFRVKGRYIQGIDKQKINNQEFIVLFSHPEEFEIVKYWAIGMGKKYKQESILLVDKTREIYFVSTCTDLPIKTAIQVGKFPATLISNYFILSEMYKVNTEHLSKNAMRRRIEDYYMNCIKECIKQDVDFYEFYYLNLHQEKVKVKF